MNILECKSIQFIKNKQTILHDISFSIEAGDRIGIIGPSGSGKSSLFRLLNLLMSPTQGEISYKNIPILHYTPMELRRNIGYVMQKPYLFGTTVKDNLLYPYQLCNQKPDFYEISNYLAKVNLSENILEKKNTALSGGEQQRIALLRSLLVKPKVVLLDEITAALDEENTLLLEKLIMDEQKACNITCLFITHNLPQAKRLAEKILHLESGRIMFWGAAAHYFAAKGEQDE